MNSLQPRTGISLAQCDRIGTSYDVVTSISSSLYGLRTSTAFIHSTSDGSIIFVYQEMW